MDVSLIDSITSNLRLQQMRTGILGSYAMHDGDWEERYRIEAAHSLTGDAVVRPRAKQQAIFEARRAAFEARRAAAESRRNRPVQAPQRDAI